MTARGSDRWARTTFGRLARIRNGADYSSVEVEEGGYPVYGSGGEFRRASSFLFDGESVLFGRKGTVDRPLYVSGKFWTVDTMFYSVIDKSRLIPRFAYYWATTLPFREWATDTALPSMTSTALKAALINLPSVPEQRAIADYLDREAAQIDAFIAKNEELITLLTERRVAAVDARILKSGADRIALQRVLRRIRQGWSPNCENSPADGISDWGVLKVGCSNTGQFDPRENKKLPESEKPRPDLVVTQDEIVMSRSNTRELVGAAAVVSAQYPKLMLSDLTYGITVRPEILPEYLAWQLRGRLVRGQIETAAKGTSSSMQKLSQRDIRELQVMCPPMAEQRAVVDDLNRLAADFDSARQASVRAIELARERRAALISAAVTGKIDVGVAA